MELLLKEGDLFYTYTAPYRQYILPYLQLFDLEIERLKKENQNRKISEDIYSAENVIDFVYKCSKYMSEPIRQLEYSYVLRQCYDKISSKKVIDVGCGISPLVRALAQNGADVYGVDKNDEIISYINDYNCKLRDPRVRYLSGNVVALDFPDETFDYVICISVLEHLNPNEDKKAIREMLRILKPRGKILVTVDFTTEENIPNLGIETRDKPAARFSTIKRKARTGLRLLKESRIMDLERKIIGKQVHQGATGAYDLEKLHKQLINPFEKYYFEEKPKSISLKSEDIRRFWSSTWFEGCLYDRDKGRENVSVGFVLQKSKNFLA